MSGKIAAVEAFRLYPEVVKEAWVDDAYVWPSRLPSFLVKVTSSSSRGMFFETGPSVKTLPPPPGGHGVTP